MENKSTPSVDKVQTTSLPLSRQWNARLCPSCGCDLYGMPGGKDAHCENCGYKDPCCSD